MRDLVLVLTARCNLSCSYCYEAGRDARTDMAWDTARSAIDLLLASPPDRALLALTGGEPLLAEPLFRRCVEHARHHTPAGTALRIAVSTNGTLLSESLVRFLAANDVALQVSYDGDGQDLRAAGTRPEVEGALRRIATLEPAWFRRAVRVALTLSPSTLPLLADSVEAILGLGVGDVAIAAVTHADWPAGPALEAELGGQLGRIVELCARLTPEGRDPPVALLRDPAPRELPAEAEPWCNAAFPGSIAVAPDGTAWGCPSAASSMQRLSPLGRQISDALRLGDVRDPALGSRLAGLPAAARDARALTHRRAKRSEIADCGSCEHLETCSPCALAAARLPGATEADAVPAITCALTRAAARAREALPRRPRIRSLLRELDHLSATLESAARASPRS